MTPTNDNSGVLELVIADWPSRDNIPAVLWPLIHKVITIYKAQFGDNLYSVYINGSAPRGNWQAGASDLDMVAFVTGEVAKPDELAVKERAAELLAEWPMITGIEVPVYDRSILSSGSYRGDVMNLKLAPVGLCVWGETIDFRQNLTDMRRVFGRYVDVRRNVGTAARASYSAHNLDESARRHATRTHAKQAVRVLDAIAVLRGAPLRTSMPHQLEDVARSVPEAAAVQTKLEKYVAGEVNDIEGALEALDSAIKLYGSIYPVYSN